MRDQSRNAYVLSLEDVAREQIDLVGGKGAHLGELARIEGIRVPPAFCVTTEAFLQIKALSPSLDDVLARLSRVEPGDSEAILTLAAGVRRAVEAVAIPEEIESEITRSLARLGEDEACAVRSSATAEDLPTASFAGQQESYLNITGPSAILEHISRCWASLFTDRAVTYRLRNGIDHRQVQMAVIVQRMVFPRVAGVLFTADPLTSNRRVSSVEASFGLGEGLVSGRVNADVYKVRDGEIVARTLAAKSVAIHASPAGGTEERAIEPERTKQAALTDDQVVRLAQLGRRIEGHFEHPQDIEWCLVDDEFEIVQSRPITTLFPIPATGDDENHVYLSVGHQQMMTDAMKPLGISFWQLTTPRPMCEAGGRLFVDVTRALASPTTRTGLMKVVGRSDPLTGDALEVIVERDFVPELADGPPQRIPGAGPPTWIDPDPELVAELIAQSEASIASCEREIRTRSGQALLDFILEDIEELKRILFDPRSTEVFMTAMDATWWLNEHLEAWLGEKNAVDALTQSVPHNVTSEMGLALLDVADVIRPHSEVVAFLEHVEDERFLDELPALAGGAEVRDAIESYLDRYGMRCVGEIDITRPRWSERPLALVPMILGNVANFEPGAGGRRFERGLQEAQTAEHELLVRLRALPDGEAKAAEAKLMIDRIRTFIGYREYPKYGMVSRYFVYKQALVAEAERLVQSRALGEEEDIFYLSFQELHDLVRTGRVDDELIRGRKEAFESYRTLTPPRVLTSEGEALAGRYRREDVPAGALIGLPVSAGTIEGRARVILDIAQADLEPGDILVTAYTDPSWTPLFVMIEGLVTEVGGVMTHGAVIAREYGLPAVVGVQHATELIRDGQRIRVHGTDGYVEILA